MARTEGIEALPAALAGAGYTLVDVMTMLVTQTHLSSRSEDLAIFERRAAGDSAAALLVRLFLLNLAVDATVWDRLVTALPAEKLAGWGLVESEGGKLRATVRLVPHGGIYLASDRLGTGDDPGHVTGVNNPAILLSDLAVRRQVGLGLDLGCGSGIQSLLMSRHCERVIATDVNPRALEFTELNARINGVHNIECRLGSLFEPVAGLAFDLILSNPPYVISPESSLLYRDSGREADAFCRELVGEAASHLALGGFAQMLVSWAERAGDTWQATLREWVAGAPCDSLFLHYSHEDPLSHAARWNRPPDLASMLTFQERVDRWMDYYAEQGIEAIGFGSVTLRRASRPGWIRTDELRQGSGAAGEHLVRVFEGEDLLRSLRRPRDLLQATVRMAPGRRLAQAMAVGESGGWESLATRLTMGAGLGFQGSLNLGLAQLLQHLDGRVTLGQAIDGTAAELSLRAGDVETFRGEVLVAVRRLMELGFFDAVRPAAPSGRRSPGDDR